VAAVLAVAAAVVAEVAVLDWQAGLQVGRFGLL
jgi:hypothetical protein